MKGDDIRKLVALTLVGIAFIALLWHSRSTLRELLPWGRASSQGMSSK